jgi:hypothetical protein
MERAIKRSEAKKQKATAWNLLLAVLFIVGLGLAFWQVIQPDPIYLVVYTGIALMCPGAAAVIAKKKLL